MLAENYFFINHIYFNNSLTVNLIALGLLASIFVLAYFIYRKKLKIADIWWKSVIFFVIIFVLFLASWELNWLKQDLKELKHKDSLERAVILHDRFVNTSELSEYMLAVKENTKPGSTAVFISPFKFEATWLRYYLFPDLEILYDNSTKKPDYLLIFGFESNTDNLILIKEVSSTAKIYATSAD